MSVAVRSWVVTCAVLAALLVAACGGGSTPSTLASATPVATTPPPTSAATSTATPTATATREPTPTPTAQVDISTDRSTVYYNVYGTTTDDIFDSIDANGPRLDDGGLGLGLTSWSFSGLDWDRESISAGCRLESFTLTVKIVVTLPVLVDFDSAPAEIQQRWEQLADEIAVHEQKHVDIVEAGIEALGTQIQSLGSGSSCLELDGSLEQLLDDENAEIAVENDAFHAEDDAFLEARRVPLQQQIDTNQAELTRLDVQIEALKSSLDATEATIDSLGTYLTSLEAEIGQIEQSYPTNVLPPDVYARYDALIQEYNSNLAQYNALVDQYNQSLSDAQALTDQYNTLVDTTNGLVEDLIWYQ